MLTNFCKKYMFPRERTIYRTNFFYEKWAIKYRKLLLTMWAKNLLLTTLCGNNGKRVKNIDLSFLLPKKNRCNSQRMIFLTDFFKSAVRTPNIKVVAQITSYPSSGRSARIVKFFLDKKILQAGDNFSKITPTSRGPTKIFCGKKF